MSFTPTADISTRFPVSADIVWAALTKHRYTSEWWPSLQLPKRSGARASFQTPRPRKKRPRVATGRVVRVTKGEEIQLSLLSQPRGVHSDVTITVTQLAHKTRVRVVEQGFAAAEDPQRVIAESRDGWREFLGALGEYLADNKTVARIERRIHDA